MKKNKTEQHKGKLTPNAVLNEVGGAVKLKWRYNKKGEFYWADYLQINVERYFKKYESKNASKQFTLMMNNIRIKPFKKLSSAKIVAQLIYNG